MTEAHLSVKATPETKISNEAAKEIPNKLYSNAINATKNETPASSIEKAAESNLKDPETTAKLKHALAENCETKAEVIEKNREEGADRENQAHTELKEKYPESDGYKIEREQYLRDANGSIVKDPLTGEGRRIDFVITKDGKVVDAIEVTSFSAPKDSQIAKEGRIRENGGNFIKDRATGELIKFPDNLQTNLRRYA